jgi:hypothetical protein
MAKTKYLKFYELMTEKNSELFDRFQKIHDEYLVDSKKNEAKFHQEGQEVLDVIRDWERRLCSGMERGVNAVYSQKVSEKFWGEVKKRFSLVEKIGIKVRVKPTG